MWSGSSSTTRILACAGQGGGVFFGPSATDLKIVKLHADGSGGVVVATNGECLGALALNPLRAIFGKLVSTTFQSGVDLWIRDLTSGTETPVTDFHGDPVFDFEASEHSPAASPDGTKIAYLREFVMGTPPASSLQGDNASLNQASEFGLLGIVNADGTGRTEFPLPVIGPANNPRKLVLSSPAWRPDGQRIAFVGTALANNATFLSDTTALYSIKPDGTDLVRHTPFNAWPGLRVDRDFARALSWGSLCQTLLGCNASITLVQSPLSGFTLNSEPALNGPASVGFMVQRKVGKRFTRVGRVPFGTRRRGAKLHWNLRLDGKPLSPGTYRITLRVLADKIPLELSKPIGLIVPRHGAPRIEH